jgi:plastocyanin
MKIKTYQIIIILIAAIFVLAWIAQDFTNFKIVNFAKNFVGKFNLSNLGAPLPTPIPGKQLNIFIRENGFVPNNTELEAEGRVTWYNEDTRSHSVASENWVSPVLEPGEIFSKIFDQPGIYKYHDAAYPDLTGEFTVR